MSRTVFIDFDGTLADHGRVPAAHLDAVGEARARGNQVLLCTGRPKSLVPHYLQESVFDGLVLGAGSYVEIDGQVLLDTRFPDEIASRTVSLFDEHQVIYILEAPQAVFCRTGSAEHIRTFFDGKLWSIDPDDQLSELVAALQPADDLHGYSFGKAIALDSPELSVEELATAIGSEVGVIPSSVPDVASSTGEFYLQGIDKTVGIAVAAKYFGISSTSEIIAIGDSLNDVEMVAQAGVGVVVEGAPEELLRHAAFTIPGPLQHGLVEGFSRLGLI